MMPIQPYLDQLCEDLNRRNGVFPTLPDIRALAPDQNFPEEMESSMQFLYGPQYSMAELFELEADAFPPVEKLSEGQITQLTGTILELWRSVNLEADLPNNIPLKYVYPKLLTLWREEPVSVVKQGSIHLEFCSYEPEQCPWPEQFCHCKDMFEEGEVVFPNDA